MRKIEYPRLAALPEPVKTAVRDLVDQMNMALLDLKKELDKEG